MNGSTTTEERQDRSKEGVGSRLQSTPARADRARAPPPPAALRHTSPLPHTRGDRAGGARRARGPILPWIAPPCTQPLPRSRRQTMQASSKQAVTYQRPGWWRRGRGGRQRSSWLKGCWDCACGCACGCGVGVSAGIDGTKGPTRLRDETTPGGGPASSKTPRSTRQPARRRAAIRTRSKCPRTRCCGLVGWPCGRMWRWPGPRVGIGAPRSTTRSSKRALPPCPWASRPLSPLASPIGCPLPAAAAAAGAPLRRAQGVETRPGAGWFGVDWWVGRERNERKGGGPGAGGGEEGTGVEDSALDTPAS